MIEFGLSSWCQFNHRIRRLAMVGLPLMCQMSDVNHQNCYSNVQVRHLDKLQVATEEPVTQQFFTLEK